MPRFPSHRLDVLIVPADPDRDPPMEPLWQALVDANVVRADGSAGTEAGMMVSGGFRRARLDRPGHTVLYANRQGGFRVRCPVSGANLVDAFSRALTAWRQGGARHLSCVCGSEHALEDLDFAPPAAFARAALVLTDAEHHAPTAAGAALVGQHWGAIRWIAQRVG